MMNNLKIFLLFFLILVHSIALANENGINRIQISLFAEDFVSQHIAAGKNDKVEIKSHKIDNRITVKSCDTDLQGKMPANKRNRRLIVQVICPSEKSQWKMFVPVKVTHLIPVVTAAKNLDKGSIIDNTSLEITYKNKANVRRESFSDLTQFLNAKAKRRISAGQLIGKQNICFVCQGETVTIAAETDSFQIKTSAVALSDGAIGDIIRVRNKRSGKVVEARITSVNTLAIQL